MLFPMYLIFINIILIALQLPRLKNRNAEIRKSAKTVILISALALLCGIAALLRR